ncbi:MAG TPA: hypothetical protein VIL42_07270 [Sphingomicrobium sp.]|jgi:hypothetical protein
MVKKIYDTASDVHADDGAVSVEGPDGVSVQLTPEAAEKTANALAEGVVVARGQRRSRSVGPRGTEHLD